MFSRAEIKKMARAQIKGNLLVLFLCNLVPILISSFANYLGDIAKFAQTITQPAFSMGLVMIYLSLSYGERPVVSDVFKGFNIFVKSLWLYFLIAAFTFLWSLLFVIPGIIKGMSYSMAPYILAENPAMDAMDAINESRKLTDGHKGDLFIFWLSFIGWALLMIIPTVVFYAAINDLLDIPLLGWPFTLAVSIIPGMYVVPYMQASGANFYNALKAVKWDELSWIEEVEYERDNYGRGQRAQWREREWEQEPRAHWREQEQEPREPDNWSARSERERYTPDESVDSDEQRQSAYTTWDEPIDQNEQGDFKRKILDIINAKSIYPLMKPNYDERPEEDRESDDRPSDAASPGNQGDDSQSFWRQRREILSGSGKQEEQEKQEEDR